MAATSPSNLPTYHSPSVTVKEGPPSLPSSLCQSIEDIMPPPDPPPPSSLCLPIEDIMPPPTPNLHVPPSTEEGSPPSSPSSLCDRIEEIMPPPTNLRGPKRPSTIPLSPSSSGSCRIEDITPAPPSDLTSPPMPPSLLPSLKEELPSKELPYPGGATLPPAVLMSCAHDGWQLAAGVLPREHDLSLCGRCSPSSHPPWWQRSHASCAIRCPHGFALAQDSALHPPRQCTLPECIAASAAALPTPSTT